MKKSRKLLSMLLAMCMIVSCVTEMNLSVFAAGESITVAGQTLNSATPYLLNGGDKLKWSASATDDGEAYAQYIPSTKTLKFLRDTDLSDGILYMGGGNCATVQSSSDLTIDTNGHAMLLYASPTGDSPKTASAVRVEGALTITGGGTFKAKTNGMHVQNTSANTNPFISAVLYSAQKITFEDVTARVWSCAERSESEYEQYGYRQTHVLYAPQIEFGGNADVILSKDETPSSNAAYAGYVIGGVDEDSDIIRAKGTYETSTLLKNEWVIPDYDATKTKAYAFSDLTTATYMKVKTSAVSFTIAGVTLNNAKPYLINNGSASEWAASSSSAGAYAHYDNTTKTLTFLKDTDFADGILNSSTGESTVISTSDDLIINTNGKTVLLYASVIWASMVSTTYCVKAQGAVTITGGGTLKAKTNSYHVMTTSTNTEPFVSAIIYSGEKITFDKVTAELWVCNERPEEEYASNYRQTHVLYAPEVEFTETANVQLEKSRTPSSNAAYAGYLIGGVDEASDITFAEGLYPYTSGSLNNLWQMPEFSAVAVKGYEYSDMATATYMRVNSTNAFNFTVAGVMLNAETPYLIFNGSYAASSSSSDAYAQYSPSTKTLRFLKDTSGLGNDGIIYNKDGVCAVISSGDDITIDLNGKTVGLYAAPSADTYTDIIASCIRTNGSVTITGGGTLNAKVRAFYVKTTGNINPFVSSVIYSDKKITIGNATVNIWACDEREASDLTSFRRQSHVLYAPQVEFTANANVTLAKYQKPSATDATHAGYIIGGVDEASDVIMASSLHAYTSDEDDMRNQWVIPTLKPESIKSYEFSDLASATYMKISSSVVSRTPATGISLDQTALNIEVGSKKTLTANVKPSGATNTHVVWTSSNPEVATVDSSGKVTAIAVGNANVTARAKDGNFTATCVVNVMPKTVQGAATEVRYCGYVLNASTPYLIGEYVFAINSGEEHFQTHVAASDVDITETQFVVAYFEATTGTLTFRKGMPLVNDEDGYEPDFGWDSMKKVELMDGDYYGIYSNGDLIIDLGGYTNFIWCPYNVIYKQDLYGIYSKGDLTIRGDGLLKLPATLAMNNDGTNGDANAQRHTSYGIYAEGDVHLDGGTIMIYSRNTVRWQSGTNAYSVGVHAEKAIYLNGTTLKFRYEEATGQGVIKHFNEEPNGLSSYVKEPVQHVNMTSGQYNSLGFCYIDNTITNNNCFNYYLPVPATGVRISRRVLDLTIGDTTTLQAKVMPEGASDKAVSWSSSDESVVTVDNGFITAVGVGTAVITAVTNGTLTNECKVTVNDVPAPIAVTGITLPKNSLSLMVTDQVNIGYEITPDEASNKAIKWTSSNPAVAVVTGGLVTAVSAGTTVITATTEDGGFTATCTVTVSAYDGSVKASGVVINQDIATLTPGNSTSLTTTFTPANTTNKAVSWASSDTSVATINASGTVTAIKPGIVTITATAQNGVGSDTSKVVVLESNPSVKLYIDGVQKNLSHKLEVTAGGVVYFPLIETFSYLGVNMTTYRNNVYTGKGHNGDIVVAPGKDTAQVDWIDVELPAPTYMNNGDIMVPAYFIEDALKTAPATYDPVNRILSVTSPNPNDKYSGDTNYAAIMSQYSSQVVARIDNSAILPNSGLNYGGNYISPSKVNVTVGGQQKQAVQLITQEWPYGDYGVYPELGKSSWVIRMTNGVDLHAGDVVMIHFKARATSSSEDTGIAHLRVQYERGGDWAKPGQKDFEIRYNEWNDYYLPFFARRMGSSKSDVWAANNSYVMFCVAGLPQTIQITDFEVVYYGTNIDYKDIDPEAGSYHGIESDALWRKQAQNRIEKYRKDDVEVRVVDTNGNPVSGAEVTVHQTESEFMFGTEVCSDELLDLDLTTDEGVLMDTAIDSFNYVVCGLETKMAYAVSDDGVSGIRMANDILSRGKRFKGHAIFWDRNDQLDYVTGADYTTKSYEEIYRKVMDFIGPEVYAFRGHAVQWDVLNEITLDNYIRTNRGTSRLYSDVTKAVHEIDPTAKLYVNETNTEGKNKGGNDRIPTVTDLIRQMKEEGAHIDGIGLQTHEMNYYYPMGLYHQMDECLEVVDEVAVTEYDFTNPYTANQSQYMADNLLVSFSHPKCTAFIFWGYNAPHQAARKAAFYDISWDELEFKQIWDKMVMEDFKTNTVLTSDSTGHADFRGFHGDYDITVSYGGKEETFGFGLVKDSDNCIVITVGNNITADVTSGKYVSVPSKIKYNSFSEAEKEYRKEFGKDPYTAVMLDARFRGALASGSTAVVINNSYATNANYTAGNVWGTTGISAVASDDTQGRGIAVNNSKSGSYTMSRKFTNTAYNNGEFEMSYIIETTNARPATTASIDLALMNASGTTKYGSVNASSAGYYVETLSGKKLYLGDNTIYDIAITVSGTPGNYYVKYKIKNGEIFENEWTDNKVNVANLTSFNGLSFTIKATGTSTSTSTLYILRHARIKFYSYDDLLTFSTVGNTAEVISDSMLHFDMNDVVSTDDAAYIDGEKWGSNAANPGDYFRYDDKTDHVFGIRTAPDGENRLMKKMVQPEENDSLEVKFDFYVDAPSVWYGSNNYVDVSLTNEGGNLKKTLARFEFTTANGYRLMFLGKSASAYGRTETGVNSNAQFNKNNMKITCTLTKNSVGNYDATMTIVNKQEVVTNVTFLHFMTNNEFKQLNTFRLATRTEAVGTKYGKNLAGIKNVVVTKTAATAATTQNGAVALANGSVGGIRFENPTKRPFDATVIFAGYIDGSLSSISVNKVEGRRDASGYLSIPVAQKNANENSYKAMLWDGTGALQPLKSADNVTITQ